MECYIIGIAAMAVLVLIAVRANHRLRHFDELPMQWGLDGKPTWHASRRLALAFTPFIGAVVFSAIALKEAGRPEGPVMTLAVAGAIIAAQLLHLAILRRTLRS